MPKSKKKFLTPGQENQIREMIRAGKKQGIIKNELSVRIPDLGLIQIRIILNQMIDAGENNLRCTCGKPYSHAGYCDKPKETIPLIEKIITPEPDVALFVSNNRSGGDNSLSKCQCGRFFRKQSAADDQCGICRSNKRVAFRSLRAPEFRHRDPGKPQKPKLVRVRLEPGE